MQKVNVLIIGGGGREHSTFWKLMQSPQAGNIYAAPGNPGMAMMGCKNIPIAPTSENFGLLADIAENLKIGLVFVGPDNALHDGIARVFTHRGIPTFGPSHATIIESSKVFAKELMRKVGIPTADFEVFSDPNAAKKYAASKKGEVAVKADGLALGKGARVCSSIEESSAAIDDFMIKKTLGQAGEKIVIEDVLEGQELSIHALCDGDHVKLLLPVRDHKHLLDGGKGPMTGGMGVCGPIPVSDALMEKIEQEIVLPCIRELASRNMPFVGCLYPGLMLTADGPKVLEFNARFGDPETQVLMRLLKYDVDLIDVFLACTSGRLDKVELRWKDAYCTCVVLVAEGYPGNPRKGDKIELGSYTKTPAYSYDPGSTETVVFHAGTAFSNGELVTNGGRVLGVTTLFNNTLPLATGVAMSYLEIDSQRFKQIGFHGAHFRRDIGKVW